MNAWVVFRRARIMLFSFLVFLCLTWTTLFAVFLAHEWSQFSQSQKIVVASLLSVYGFTAILLYLMVVVRFRLWWDIARAVTLFIIHAGSSLVFWTIRSGFTCRGFNTEAFCNDFVFVISIGCWVFSAMILCFSTILGIMAFLPRPVDSLSGSKEADFPPSPASFKAGSPSVEEANFPYSPVSYKAGSPSIEERPPSFHSFDPRMGPSYHDDTTKSPNQSLFPARALVVANRDPEEPVRLGKSFQPQRLRINADDLISTKTINTRTDSPVKPASVDVKSRRRQPDPLYLDLFGTPSPPPLPVYTPVAETGNESPSVSLSMPRGFPTPNVMYGPRPMTSDPMYRDRAAPYTPTSYADPSAHPFPAALRETHQSHHSYPDVVPTAAPGVYSFRSATASVHSSWAVSPSHFPPPPSLTPGVARPSQPLRSTTDPRSMSHAQNPTRIRKLSEPNPNHGGGLGHRSYALPVAEMPLQRRGSDGQVVDHAEWRRLVLDAAAKP